MTLAEDALIAYRPTWEDTWLATAFVISQRSRCSKAKVGAMVVTVDQQPVIGSYNGPPAGMKLDGACHHWCPRAKSGIMNPDYGSCPSVHAEANALLRADYNRIKGGTIYVTRACCMDCAKLVAGSGLAHLVHAVGSDDAHRDPDRVERFLVSAGVRVSRAWYDVPGHPPRLGE